MKIKGLRWFIIGLIMLITVINYLDRGTLNYMWVANIEYNLENEIDNNLKINQAVKRRRHIQAGKIQWRRNHCQSRQHFNQGKKTENTFGSKQKKV